MPAAGTTNIATRRQKRDWWKRQQRNGQLGRNLIPDALCNDTEIQRLLQTHPAKFVRRATWKHLRTAPLRLHELSATVDRTIPAIVHDLHNRYTWSQATHTAGFMHLSDIVQRFEFCRAICSTPVAAVSNSTVPEAALSYARSAFVRRAMPSSTVGDYEMEMQQLVVCKSRLIAWFCIGDSLGWFNVPHDRQDAGKFILFAISVGRMPCVQAAKDLVDDVRHRLLERHSDLDAPDDIQPYFSKCIVNLWRDRQRKDKSFTKCMPDIATIIRDRLSTLSPAIAVEDHELRALLLRAVEQLPERQRQCILMYYWEGLQPRQIADKLGIKSGTVTKNLRLGRDKLAAFMNDYSP